MQEPHYSSLHPWHRCICWVSFAAQEYRSLQLLPLHRPPYSPLLCQCSVTTLINVMLDSDKMDVVRQMR